MVMYEIFVVVYDVVMDDILYVKWIDFLFCYFLKGKKKFLELVCGMGI